MEESKQNRARLQNCPKHNFTIPLNDPRIPTLVTKFKCEICEGIISAGEKDWYEKGLEQGRK